MSDHDEQDRVELPLAGSETETLLGSLDRQRATFAWKCGGLDSVGLQATVGASTVTLGGLLKHMALVEYDYFSYKLAGQAPGPGAPWGTVDWDADPDWEWHTAVDDTPEQLMTLWHDEVARSRSSITEALANGGLDQLVTRITNDRGESPSLRRTLIDIIEEYARHVGHADLIRESVDGLVGEDPPR
ncbi:MAG TPA: DinB family protein [Actinomycetota bacterium]